MNFRIAQYGFLVAATLLVTNVHGDLLRPMNKLPGCELQRVADGTLVDLAEAQRGKKTMMHLYASW